MSGNFSLYYKHPKSGKLNEFFYDGHVQLILGEVRSADTIKVFCEDSTGDQKSKYWRMRSKPMKKLLDIGRRKFKGCEGVEK